MDEKLVLGLGAVVLIVVVLAMRGGSSGATISSSTGADTSAADGQKLSLFGALAGTAASLDNTAIAARASEVHDESALGIAKLSADFGKYQIDAAAQSARESRDAAQAINDRNAGAQIHESNNNTIGAIIATAASVLVSIFG
jgi:hypothetical protein